MEARRSQNRAKNLNFSRLRHENTPGIAYERIRNQDLLWEFRCPHCKTEFKSTKVPHSKPCVKKIGYYERENGQTRVGRYLCLSCKRSFSSSTRNLLKYTKRRDLASDIYLRLSGHSTQRRTALELNVSRGTIARYCVLLGRLAMREHAHWMKTSFIIQGAGQIAGFQFDEMSSFEHSKYKSLSIAVAVEAKTLNIVGFSVSKCPPQKHYTGHAQVLYGARKNQRTRGIRQLIAGVSPFLANSFVVETDQCPIYSKLIKSMPRGEKQSTHVSYKSRKAIASGFGEVKVGYKDPLFPVNHSCAMLRANASRLIRKTWSTTKKRTRLYYHLAIVIHFINRVLIPLRKKMNMNPSEMVRDTVNWAT